MSPSGLSHVQLQGEAGEQGCPPGEVVDSWETRVISYEVSDDRKWDLSGLLEKV